MDKSTKSLYKKGILKKILQNNKASELHLMEFLRKKNLLPTLGTPISKIEITKPIKPDNQVENETLGDLIDVKVITEYDKDEENKSDLRLRKAKLLDGSDAAYYAQTSDAYETLWEMSASTILGQLFGIVYPNDTHAEPLPVYANFDSSFLPKIVSLDAPFPNDVFVKSTTLVSLPENKEEVYFATIGNSNMQFCGVEATLDTHLSYKLPGNNSVISISNIETFIRALRSAGNEDIDEYKNMFTIHNIMKLPAGVNEFVFLAHLLNRAYSSNDYSVFPNQDNDKFGFAMIDLRDKLFGKQFPIMRDPLGAWEKQPFGGARILTVLEFYTVRNESTI